MKFLIRSTALTFDPASRIFFHSNESQVSMYKSRPHNTSGSLSPELTKLNPCLKLLEERIQRVKSLLTDLQQFIVVLPEKSQVAGESQQFLKEIVKAEGDPEKLQQAATGYYEASIEFLNCYLRWKVTNIIFADEIASVSKAIAEAIIQERLLSNESEHNRVMKRIIRARVILARNLITGLDKVFPSPEFEQRIIDSALKVQRDSFAILLRDLNPSTRKRNSKPVDPFDISNLQALGYIPLPNNADIDTEASRALIEAFSAASTAYENCYPGLNDLLYHSACSKEQDYLDQLLKSIRDQDNNLTTKLVEEYKFSLTDFENLRDLSQVIMEEFEQSLNNLRICLEKAVDETKRSINRILGEHDEITVQIMTNNCLAASLILKQYSRFLEEFESAIYQPIDRELAEQILECKYQEITANPDFQTAE